MMPVFSDMFGNPSSVQHSTDRQAEGIVDEARKKVADAADMRASDVIFTSGATDANNLAINGLNAGHVNKILVGTTEHKSVLQPCSILGENGHTVIVIPVYDNGAIDLDALEDTMKQGAGMVSISVVNSETGVIQPVKKIAELAHKHDILFHCDAAQAVGKIPFEANNLGIDLITLGSHKIYGPKGCGALVANRDARKRLTAIIHGGGQENDTRSGTQNVPAIAGFGEACRIAVTNGMLDIPRQCDLRDMF